MTPPEPTPTPTPPVVVPTPIPVVVVPEPAPVVPEPTPISRYAGMVWQYWLNIVLVFLTIATTVVNIIVHTSNAQLLGLSDTTWQWLLVLSYSLAALNALFNHTPPIQKFASVHKG